MSLISYQELLARKKVAFEPRGIEPPALCSKMFPHQADVTDFLLRTGCGAAFLDTGLGKSLIALEWGRVIATHTGKPVLMLAPLAVGSQHQREAERFGIDAAYLREPPSGALPPVVITNYERLHLWDVSRFGGVILDESSILKSFDGKTKTALISIFRDMPYRLACTATPAPNDHMELGNHAEFLSVMRSSEMLSRWFVNDTSKASQKWRLKGHATELFWEWVSGWARCVSKPSDIGYSDDGFALPRLIECQHVVPDGPSEGDGSGDDFFHVPKLSAASLQGEKLRSLAARADVIAAQVQKDPGEAWIVWVDTNAEADAMRERLPDAIEVRGSMTPEAKEDRLVAFTQGRERILITKASIAGFGLNWQHCARMAFTGVNYSYEAYYQAIRRCWRFGQTRPVHVHMAMAAAERPVFEAVMRKSDDHVVMKTAMAAAMGRHSHIERQRPYDAASSMFIPAWLR